MQCTWRVVSICHQRTKRNMNGERKNLQHLSQKNLSSAFRVSVELKFFRQLVIELFCSMSRLKSKNVSSLAVIVSHRKHLVSLVKIPYQLINERVSCKKIITKWKHKSFGERNSEILQVIGLHHIHVNEQNMASLRCWICFT